MVEVSPELVDIVRDLMETHRIMKRQFARFRKGELRFAELHELIGDDEGSVLYRLKERSHALFRPRDGQAATSTRGEALFDLAVGSLFHEAMKFRESFYQQEIYGPRVRALRSEAAEESDGLFQEFDKIFSAVSVRLDEGLQETEVLVEQTVDQLRVLLAEHPYNGFALRYLIEHRARIDEVFGCSLDALLAEIEGEAGAGYECAAHSYLESGFYEEAQNAFEAAVQRGMPADRVERFVEYARGMSAYLAGDYAECVRRLGKWFDGRDESEEKLLEIARAVVSNIDQVAQGEERERITAEAADLIERLGPIPPVENLGTGI